MLPADTPNPEVAVHDDPPHARYVIDVGGRAAGFASYQVLDGRTFFVHTEIEPGHEGAGLGSILARAALDDVASRNGKVVPICPFIASWIDKHPDYQALVDRDDAI